MKKLITNLIFSLTFLLFVSSFLYSQDADSETNGTKAETFSDTVFNDLTLTEEGIIAIDTFGNKWYYDFDLGQFVFNDRPQDKERTIYEDFSDIVEIPVEERCTELRKLPSLVTKTLIIGEDEYVDGNIIASSRVTVKGWVRGNIRSFNDRVLITGTGQVDGNIEAPRIIVKNGGVVLGREIISDSPLDLDYLTSTFNVDGVVVITIITSVFLLVGFLILSLMPRQVANFNACFEKNKLKTTLIGFLLFIFMPLVLGLVTITLIGIPLVPFIPILYVIASIMGMLAYGNKIGRFLIKRISGKETNLIFQSLTGLVLQMLLWFISMLFLGLGESYGDAFGGIFLAAAIIITFYPFFSGIGAAVLTRFGFRIYVSFHERAQYGKSTQAPAPPPIPEPPSHSPGNDKISTAPPVPPKPPSSDPFNPQ